MLWSLELALELFMIFFFLRILVLHRNELMQARTLISQQVNEFQLEFVIEAADFAA